MFNEENYFKQVINVIRALNSQYYMTYNEYSALVVALLEEVQRHGCSPEYLQGFMCATAKIDEYFDKKI